ncbi:MAG: T9SS type A sorting domain-containing protein [Bacteroidota bacterium]
MKIRFIAVVIACLSFQLLQAQFGQDCESAIKICTQEQYKITGMSGVGMMLERDKNAHCFNSQFKETNSKWLQFKIKEAGELYFTIDPITKTDDLDFILYKRSIKDCLSKEIVRCMASGLNLGSRNPGTRCAGSTGLRPYDYDIDESTGCTDSNDNFLSSIITNEGEEYLILINNYNNSDGFYFKMQGEAKLHSYDDCLDGSAQLTISSISPNPVSDVVRISFQSDIQEENGRIELLDFNGKQVLIKSALITEGSNHISIDMSDLPSGPYSVKLTTEGDTIVETLIKI